MRQAKFFLLLSGCFLFLFANLFSYQLPSFAKIRSSGKNTVEPSKENFDLGLRKYKEHDLDGAIDALLQAVYFNRSSYNPEAYYWLGICYQEKNLDAKAIEALKKSVEQSIKRIPLTHLHLSQLYLRNNRLDEAEWEANKALIDFYGPAPEAHNQLGLICEKRNELERAQDQFLDALGNHPWRYTDAWMNYAENLIKQKKWGYAITQLRNMLNHDKALKGLDPERIYFDIGICLLAKGDHQGAMDNWHETLNYNPDNAQAHLQLALLLDSERHIASAIKEYKEYIRLSPDNSEVAKIKNQVLLLEQKLRATPVESVGPYVAPNLDSLYKKEPNTSSEIQEQNNSDALKPSSKKDVLVPHSGKESGF